MLVAPPVPFLPEEVHGKQICAVIFCHTGDHAEGEKLLAPIRAAATPIADLGGPIPYAALNSLIDPLWPEGGRYYMRSGYMAELSPEAIAAIVQSHATTPMAQCEIHVHDLGGAVAPCRRGRDRVQRPQRALRAEHRRRLAGPGRRRGQPGVDP